ncbi:flagellar protein FliT [Halobacillus litoralis]|uniref:Flagellar protein FliT n=1 Tax=Halobacillus litoralis TaxID=45668 RepID=A0A410MG50_9BACI|nr:flagellar protein FliT [Halobacillus litoralis]QAS53709.1 flagellar protein FliT [Halobacillus litoralis]
MSVWTEFSSITKKLDEVVHQQVTEKNRTALIEEVEVLLDKRASMLENLPEPSQEEKPLVKEVLQRDLKINQKLEFLFDGLKGDMRNMKKQKSSKQRYINPYQSVSGYDGMYLDHKK